MSLLDVNPFCEKTSWYDACWKNVVNYDLQRRRWIQ